MKISNASRSYYLEKLNLVIQYVDRHPDKRITIEQLASLTHISQFHLHRILRAILDEPIGAYIKRTRLERAARLLVHSTIPIESISYSVGYDTPAALSKQFKKRFGTSPSDYRSNSKLNMKEMNTNTVQIKKPKVVSLESKKCIFLRLQGSYQTLDYGEAWRRLWAVVKDQKLFTKGIQHIGISYDDPDITAADKIRYDACLVVHKEAQPTGEIGVKTLPGGKFLMFHYTGSYAHLDAAYQQIFKHELLDSGHQLRDAPCREIYRNNAARTPAEKLKTEIYVPIV